MNDKQEAVSELEHPNATDPAMRRCLDVLMSAAFILSLCKIAIDQLARPLTLVWDDAQYLHFAQLMLAGWVPYVDFSDINPPMINYVSVLPVLISNLLNLHVIVVFKCLMIALSAFASILCVFIVRRHLTSPSEWRYIAVVLLVIAYFGNLLGREFGQREHILVLCYMPFFFLRWLRWQGENPNAFLAIVCGALAGVALCFKPYFLLLPLCTESYWLGTTKRWRTIFTPETLATATVGVTYALHFFFLPTATRDAIFEIASNISVFQMAYGYSLDHAIVLEGRFFPFLPVAVIVTLSLAYALRKVHSLITPLAFLVIGGYLCSVVQLKFWTYYRIPMIAALLMLAAMEAVALSKLLPPTCASSPGPWNKLGKWNQDKFLIAFSIALMIPTLISVWTDLPKVGIAFQLEQPQQGKVASQALQSEFHRLSTQDSAFYHIWHQSECGDRIIILGLIDFPAYPAYLQLGRLPGYRYTFPFPLAIYGVAAEMHQHDKQTVLKCREKIIHCLQNIIDDKKKFKPKLILVADLSDRLSRDRFYISQAVNEPWFQKELLQGYTKVQRFGDYKDGFRTYYDLYKRNDNDNNKQEADQSQSGLPGRPKVPVSAIIH